MNDSHSTDQVFISKLTEIVLDHLTDEEFSVEILAQEAGMSHANLYRRLKSIKNQDVSKFIREVRLQRAMEMLRNNEGTAAEISFKVGFGSPAYFNKCFREYFGYPPGKAKRMGSFKKKDKPRPLRSWKIAGYISFVVIVVLIVINIIPRIKRSDEIAIPDKSIAILSFKFLSEDTAKQYLARGMTEAIHYDLSQIKALRVMSIIHVEQIPKTNKTTSEICKEYGMAYLLEGSFQKNGDQIRLIVRLFECGKEECVWTGEYDKEWENIFTVQDEVAQSIAKVLQAVITPEEKQRIEKTHTLDLAAYDYYLRGEEKLFLYWSDWENKDLLDDADYYYHEALDCDSTYALAYTGLAWVYMDTHFGESVYSENGLDSCLILADKALSYDDHLALAYDVKGHVYLRTGKKEQAIEEFDKALKFNPNDWGAYSGKGTLYFYDDIVKSIDNFQIAASLYRGSELDDIFRSISFNYLSAGFSEKHNYYNQQALDLELDSVNFYAMLMRSEFYHGNYVKAMEFAEKAIKIDSLDSNILYGLGLINMYLAQYEESLKYFEKYIEKKSFRYGYNVFGESSIIGFVYWQNGDKGKAEYYFNKQIDICNMQNELERRSSKPKMSYYNLAGVHAFRGEKEKAYENLRIFLKSPKMYLENVFLINNDPLFDSIRDEPEFQQIVGDMEIKYQAEHERVRKWLEENDML